MQDGEMAGFGNCRGRLLCLPAVIGRGEKSFALLCHLRVRPVNQKSKVKSKKSKMDAALTPDIHILAHNT